MTPNLKCHLLSTWCNQMQDLLSHLFFLLCAFSSLDAFSLYVFPFFLFFFFFFISIFFHDFCGFLYTCTYLVKLFLNFFVLCFRLPTINIDLFFICFLASMSYASWDEKSYGAAICNFASSNQLGGVGTNFLVAGCFLCLSDLRRQLWARCRDNSSSDHCLALWFCKFCWLSHDSTSKTHPEGRGQQHSSHKSLHSCLAS